MLKEVGAPPFMGREVELRALRERFDSATLGRGGAVFVAGEAGIGKTSLVGAFMSTLKPGETLILAGQCLSDSLTPFLPVMEAFRRAGLARMFTEEGPPKVQGVYCATNAGLLVSHVERKETSLDPSIFASMLGVVEEFVGRSVALATETPSNRKSMSMSYGDYRVLLEHGNSVYVAVIAEGRETEFLIEDLRDVVAEVDRDYAAPLAKWDGDTRAVEGLDGALASRFLAGQYDGVDLAIGHPSVRRSRLFEEVALAMRRLASTKPLILRIEDLHAADPSTLALLHYIARSCADVPVLIIGTYRSEEITGTAASTVHRMKEEGLATVVDLPRLDAAATRALVASFLGSDVPAVLVESLHRETEGNPFFIRETIHLLVTEGHLAKTEAGWSYEPLASHRVPSRVYDAVIGRVERLGELERRTLDYCAVMGEEFEPRIIASAVGFDETWLLEILHQLQTHHRLVMPVDGRFRFDHGMIREILYDALPENLRRSYHSLLARSIEEHYSADLRPLADALALHYSRAGNVKKGVIFLMMAAADAATKYANAEALRYTDQALTLMGDRPTNRTKLEALKRKGEMHKLLGQWDAWGESAQRLLAVAGELHDPEFASIAELSLSAIASRRGEREAALDHAKRAYENAFAGGLGALEVVALVSQGEEHVRLGEHETAEGCFHGALARALALNDATSVAKAYRALGILCESRGRKDDAMSYYEKALSTFEAQGDLRNAAKVCNDIGVCCSLAGDYRKSLDMNMKCIELAKRVGDSWAVGYGKVNAGSSLAQLGDFQRAKALLEEGLETFQRLGEPTMKAAAYRELGILHSMRGDFEAALEDFKVALAMYAKDAKAPYYEAYTLRKLGETYVRKGDLVAAREAFGKSLAIYKRLGLDMETKEVEGQLAGIRPLE